MFRFSVETKAFFFFLQNVETDCQPIQPPVHWVLGGTFWVAKKLGGQDKHSAPSSAELKNKRSYNSAPSYAFMAPAETTWPLHRILLWRALCKSWSLGISVLASKPSPCTLLVLLLKRREWKIVGFIQTEVISAGTRKKRQTLCIHD